MSVRLCFVDYTKAFGCVNYWQLFKQLLEDGINAKLVRLLAYWFDKQEIFILWNGVRSCVVMEPNRVESYLYLFTRYIPMLLFAIMPSHYGCYIGN